MPSLVINGIRGIPASHGGFETFAEYLATYLQDSGWNVIVYCQGKPGSKYNESIYNGIKLITIPENSSGAIGTIIFDFRAILHSVRHKSLVLTLGYNTAVFNIIYRLCGIQNVINMDGIEWKRAKWGVLAKCWFWLNERFGCWFGNHLIADHPEIFNHLAKRTKKNKISTIAYGGLELKSSDVNLIKPYAVEPGEYALVIARAEPENSIFEIVKGFSAIQRQRKLIVLGNYDFETNDYHRLIKSVASDEVFFVGAIYDVKVVSALRYFSRCYVHGHTVGGTNPSLVESIGTGNAIIAHDNKFNRWVAKDGAIYFSSVKEIEDAFNKVLDDDSLVESLKNNSVLNFEENFRWEYILKDYELLLKKFIS